LASYRPVLEPLGLFNPISGVTNNPAESTNAAFKRISNLKNASIFQAMSIWYFYQVDILFEIFRGMKKEGTYLLCMPIPKGVYAPDNIKDVTDPKIISSLFNDGKFPPDLLTKKKYKSVSLHDATTIPGLAKWLIKEKRISWDETGVFMVTGLLEKVFMVTFYQLFFVTFVKLLCAV